MIEHYIFYCLKYDNLQTA